MNAAPERAFRYAEFASATGVESAEALVLPESKPHRTTAVSYIENLDVILFPSQAIAGIELNWSAPGGPYKIIGSVRS